ncbi:MAG: hypothetical protein P0Y53_19800 [Candidatus Pseudobacter hemicellulosilyticus]|uniref:8-oxoguanine DNA glycosylase n=1 Tax=Candidatus Pseudobacter hemicellulosilyticus TaxID=3121375 RepID=A0AAJ5WQ82_9BACT|nr:MAG: hypothetical protein P0Y53_19800 [Pseudobacter sp.]
MNISTTLETTFVSPDTNVLNFCPNHYVIEKYLPHVDNELLPGVKWGHYCQLYSPAFWKYMYLVYGPHIDYNNHKIGTTIIEEIVACILGGYGMPSELGIAAFERLRSESLIKPGISFKKIHQALNDPFELQDGSLKRYRFYNQKSKYVYNLLQRSDLDKIPLEDDGSLRTWLLSVDGIGFKTASWITRNWLQSENVAILDIHILRAGKIAGFFSGHCDVATHYLHLETSYISFCNALGVLPSNMDAIIWNYMKKTNKLALQVLSIT